MFITFSLNRMIVQLSGIHDWVDYVPAKAEAKDPDDICLRVGNSMSIKVTLNDCGFDYTPCVSNKSLLEVYKNFEYSVDAGDSDSSQDEIERISKIYKTNTRLVTLFRNVV
mmetsp:Transcript_1669/g.2080  ORF Transcript_1669/g.2080 Transcript_1669/m.2080 type:complete len:111 (+) Transcript_1669:716-1048(+)